MKLEINTSNYKFRWHVADDRLNVIRPLMDLLGDPEETIIKVTLWEKFTLFWFKLWSKLTRKKVKIVINDTDPLGVGAKMPEDWI